MDKDKKDKKPARPDRMVEVLVLVLMVFFIWMVIARIQQLLAYYTGDTFQLIWSSVVDFFLTYLWPILIALAGLVAGLSIIGIFYNKSKLKEIEVLEEAVYGKPAPISTEVEPEVKNMKWERVQQLVNSGSESDWRQAIIESDILLDELLTSAQYHGDSIGDKLQSVEPSDFLTLDSAWSAHKVRNRIAHDGASFPLNQREANQAISQYEAVFKEFKII